MLKRETKALKTFKNNEEKKNKFFLCKKKLFWILKKEKNELMFKNMLEIKELITK